MRALLASLLCFWVLVVTGVALAAPCTSDRDDTWANQSWTGGSCTTALTDDYLIDHDVLVAAVLGTTEPAGTAISGNINVRTGGALSAVPGIVVNLIGSITFEAGSCPNDSCIFQGEVFAEIGAPAVITYPDTTHIRLDFSEMLLSDNGAATNIQGLPFVLADSGCAAGTVHKAVDENCAASYAYVGWEKFGLSASLKVPNQPSRDFIDVPGMWLEVTDVDETNKTIDLVLPSVSAIVLANTYTVDEAETANVLHNVFAVWTVGDVLERENNEGKWRYETIVEDLELLSTCDVDGERPGTGATACNPAFNALHEFEGYLACRSGTDDCLRITFTIPDYCVPGPAHDPGEGGDGHQVCVPDAEEMFSTWGDPRKKWAIGDTLDIYYAKLNEGDSLTFLNPVFFDHTGSSNGSIIDSSFTVEYGSELFTLTGIVWQDAWAEGFLGCVSLQNVTNSDIKTVDLVLSEGCGDDPAVPGPGSSPAAFFINDTADGPLLDGGTNNHWSRMSVRFMQGQMDHAGNPTVPGINSFAIQWFDVQDERVGNKAQYDDDPANIGVWSGNKVRKVRGEGVDMTIGGAPGGHFVNCPDGLSHQDILHLHGRLGNQPNDVTHNGADMMETFGQSPTCGIDRIAIMANDIGAGLNVRHSRQGPGTTWFTSLMVAGGTTDQGIDIDAGDGVFLSGALRYQGPNPEDLQGHAHSFPDALSNGVKLVNFMTDGRMTSASGVRYWAQVGWWRSNGPTVYSVECGSDSVGGWQVGGRPAARMAGLGRACEGTHTDVKFIDNYYTNQGGWQNIGTDSTCDANGDNPGTSFFMCHGAATGQNEALFAWTSGIVSPAADVYIDGLLFHNGDHKKGFSNMLDFEDIATGKIASVIVKNSTFLQDVNNVFRMVWMDGQQTDVTYMQIGPNVFGDGGINSTRFMECNVQIALDGNPTSPAWHPDCDFTSDAGGGLDFSPFDDSPNGTAVLGFSGDLTTGKNIYPVSTDIGDISGSMPRWAGPIVWDWPFQWVTAEPVGFHRTAPRDEFIPKILRDRMASSAPCLSLCGATLSGGSTQ